MKKFIKTALAGLMFTPAIAGAGILIECPENNSICQETLIGLITKISNVLLSLVGVVAVLFLILGGFQYITSAGNPENVSKAKNTILYAIIGIIVTLLSWAVVKFIIDSLVK